MSDLFHELVPAEFVEEVIAVMELAGQHTFQVLTKRPERARDLLVGGVVRPLPRERLARRLDRELALHVARARAEGDAGCGPLHFGRASLGSLSKSGRARKPLELGGIDWLIAGGESGAHARPMQVAWARELRDACRKRGVAFFFKQWGGRTSKAGGRVLDNQTYDEMPERLFATA